MPRRALLSVLAAAVLIAEADPLDAQSLRGSRARVDRVYEHAVRNDLRFHASAQSIRAAVDAGTLVRLQPNRDYRLHDVSYPFALPAARTFVERLAGQYRSACGEQLVVTSATRPTSLRLVNSVARTVHPTGMAIDLRKPANPSCLRWLRNTLTALDAAGVIEATEEFRPPHFHIAIYPAPYSSYVQNRGGSVYASAPRVAAVAPSSATSRYVVRRGDSLWAIARRHSTTVDRLRTANGLRGTTLQIGQVLVIPD